MGNPIEDGSFSQSDFSAFSSRLEAQLGVLKKLIRQQGFGQDPLKIGAELEMYLVDNEARVAPCNLELLEAADDKQFQAELNRYNMELNLSVFELQGRPFSLMRQEILDKTGYLERIAAEIDTNIVAIGILPTLRQHHLKKEFMTPLPRYQALARRLYEQRGEAFQLNINGEEPVSVTCDDVTAEGANTSFQVHMMMAHDKFASTFNAAQLTQPFVTAVSANSPILLGRLSWDETRVALFKQALDVRLPDDKARWRRPSRVGFGYGWVRRDSWELFAEAVALNPPLLPVLSRESSSEARGMNRLPALDELAVHMGTIWPWNRPVYSAQGSGHVRMEMRAIPAGPTSLDMVANAAFAIGLAAGFAADMEDMMAALPFRHAEYNFYRAAQQGMDASIVWPRPHTHQLVEVPIRDLFEPILDTARRGLQGLGVDASDIKQFLGIIAERIDSGVTGARWQRQTLKTLEVRSNRDEACQQMVKQYVHHARSCIPVSQWPRIA